MSTPTTFEAHGQDWFPHTPGDPMPCDGNAKIAFILRGDVNQRFQNEANSASRLNWGSKPFGSSNAEVIGWRFANPAQEKDELKIPDHLAEKLKAHVGAPSELARLREIVDACMKAMPCGNIATHTPENLAGRIGELAQSLAAESLENEGMRTAIKEGHTALEKVYLAYCSTTADVEDCGIDNIARDALATLSPFTSSK